MRVLLFGGAGYIGSHVALSFLENGDTVGIFDNLSTGLLSNVDKRSKFYEGDILDRERVREVLSEGWDTAVFLAAYKAAGESMIKPDKYSENNITGALIVISECVRANCLNFILSSSAAVYGEPMYNPVDEKHPTDPVNYYGYTKLCIEENLKWYSKLKDLKFVSLRYFNAAGYDVNGKMTGMEKNPANLIPLVMECAIGMRDKVCVFGNDYDTFDGTGVRDYIHVNDLASAHLMGAEYLIKEKKDLIVNLGTGKGYSVKDVIRESRRISGQEIPSCDIERRAGDPATLLASSDKAQEILGWKAKYSDLETILDSTWRVYKLNAEKNGKTF